VHGRKALRAQLGLSAADFSRLVGASGQAIYNWEARKAVPRASLKAAFVAVRDLGTRAAVLMAGSHGVDRSTSPVLYPILPHPRQRGDKYRD
jgi:DNA-binding XRE family transcriptional regulator